MAVDASYLAFLTSSVAFDRSSFSSLASFLRSAIFKSALTTSTEVLECSAAFLISSSYCFSTTVFSLAGSSSSLSLSASALVLAAFVSGSSSVDSESSLVAEPAAVSASSSASAFLLFLTCFFLLFFFLGFFSSVGFLNFFLSSFSVSWSSPGSSALVFLAVFLTLTSFSSPSSTLDAAHEGSSSERQTLPAVYWALACFWAGAFFLAARTAAASVSSSCLSC